MNKKGFTLVEILAVVAILGVLMVVAIPSINAVSNKIKTRNLNTKKELAEEALVLWEEDNKKCLTGTGVNCLNLANCTGTTTMTCTTTYKDMADYGLISYDSGTDVINPVTKASINNKKITITYNVNNGAITAVSEALNE